MKHKKLSITVVSAFIAALGLTSCSSNVSASENSIVTLHGYDGQEIEIDTNAIYDKFKYSENGINSFYQAILEVIIRNFYETSTDTEVSSRLAEMESEARNDVLSDQEQARDNATTNGTDYDTEWEKILSNAGVEDEEGLYQQHLYDLERADYEDRYFDDHKSSLTSEYIGFVKNSDNQYENYEGDHASMYPYHVRHILVNATASATDYVTSEITAQEAQNLSTVYKALSNGRNTFGQVAHDWSEDTSSSSYGDAGIMDTSTSFVNEFKLGLYAFDTIYGVNVTGDAASKANKLGTDGSYNESETTIAQQLESIGLAKVSYEVFEFLADHYDEEKSDSGLTVNDGAARYFPRNIFWNAYLNLHNVFVITDEQLDTNEFGGTDNSSYVHYSEPAVAIQGRAGFRNVPALQQYVGNHRVLTDENGRVIVGVRSEYGIHFMIMQRTPFEFNGTISGYNTENSSYVYNDTSIDEYYTTYTPGEQNYPKNTNGTDKVTYVNFMLSEDSTYQSRADEVEELIKGFDDMYDYRIFEDLMDKGQIKINDETVAQRISDFISLRREYNEWNASKTLNDSWNTYLDKIALQYEIRDDENGLDESSRLIKVTCGIHFGSYDPDDPLWEIGGACYYETKLLPLLLAPALLLSSCSSEIIAYPTDNDDPLIVQKDGADLDPEIYNNIMSVIYDAMRDNGSVASDVLNEVLYQFAISVFGDYNELKDLYSQLKEIDGQPNTYQTNAAIDEFINSHPALWIKNAEGERLTDATSKNKEYILLKKSYERIVKRISQSFYEDITSGSYLRNGYFYETDYLMSLRNSINNVASPFENSDLLHDKYLILPEIKEDEVFTYNWGEEGKLNGLLTESLYENEEKGYDYISRTLIPEIYRNLLVEQYLFDNNYSTLGRAYARDVDIITISNRDNSPLLASNLMNAYVDTYINTNDHELAQSASFDIISTAWRGVNVPNYSASTLANSESIYDQAAFLLNEAGATHSSYNDSLTGFTDTTYEYWNGTSYGDMVTDLSKVNKNPLLTDSTIESEFTNSGEYTVAQGVVNKRNDILKESYTTDGWYIRNGGLEDLGTSFETIRTRLFNIGVANALDNKDYPDRFTYDEASGTWTYSIPEGEGNYVAKIHGRYFLKPVTRENPGNENIDYTIVDNRLKDILWSDSEGNYTIVEIKQAVSSSKLAKNASTNYESIYNGLEGFMLMEDISHEVAYVVSQNDSYRTLSTQYWLEAASLVYHDQVIYDYFVENYPELFE